MAIRVYLWLKDDGGNNIKGSVDVRDREGSIELITQNHYVRVPVDTLTGKQTGTREHGAYGFTKEVDSSSTYLYKAASIGQTLKSAEFRFYRINYAGQEENYFTTLLENVRVTSVSPFMFDIKSDTIHNHLEYVTLSYERITWTYLDGNVIYSDSWNERRTA
ncbi:MULTISPECIES: Hcp family type VI secretion system effector [Pseudescherichia]|uniref:Hcp family type VI secretion system effector n=1 Tax=Pseudescherichia TaxID=2055880 RepID=UPI00289EE9BB|nr:type VI secretion system tube protein TssD [Pseudescherichia sp.]